MQHCHAVLAGLKVANYFCLRQSPQVKQALLTWHESFADSDLSFKVLCTCHDRFGILLYNHRLLAERLEDRAVQDFLKDYGYADFRVNQALKHLAKRLREPLSNGKKLCLKQHFPHEIGVFLGYPLADIEAFIREGGQNALLVGHWKVYHDVQAAKHCFDQYKLSLRLFRERLAAGNPLSESMLMVRAELPQALASLRQRA